MPFRTEAPSVRGARTPACRVRTPADMFLPLVALFLLVTSQAQASSPVLLIGDEPGAWSRIFASVGLEVSQATDLPPTALRNQIEAGAFAILEGDSEFAQALGIRAGTKKVSTRNIVDEHNPKLPIIWEKALDVPEYTLPGDSRIFTRERWSGIPLVAGLKRGKGAVLWLSTRPGARGYERFPYLIQAMTALGLEVPLRSNRLWAFLDTSYRTRVDVEYFARRWARAGISALHIAAWHYNEPDAERDKWLRGLIEACHRQGVLVYAWLELPHVSERFWQDHPEWREKTALQQDAHLDWRKLMNLSNRDCFRAVESATHALIERFDWDGVNLGELYFESLEGAANASRFTPMNADIRAEYKQLTDIDPLTLFQGKPSPDAMAAFLQYRAGIARRMQAEWIGVVDAVRRKRSSLDLVLTHVDDRFDTGMRELIGADAAAVLPMLERHDFTFLIEDPATVWHLGPERYSKIAEQYKPLTPKQEKLAIDINIVERYQDVYPTKQQTGIELFQLVHLASEAFERVALYFESSILKPDVDLLPAAAAAVRRFERRGSKVIIDSPRGAGVRWTGPALVNGRPWPILSDDTVWLPPGAHVVDAGAASPKLRVTSFNGNLRSASTNASGIEISYSSSSRALATVDRRPEFVEIDGVIVKPEWFGETTLVLPRGQHIVSLR